MGFTYIMVWLGVAQNWLSFLDNNKKWSDPAFTFDEGYVSIYELSAANGIIFNCAHIIDYFFLARIFAQLEFW